MSYADQIITIGRVPFSTCELCLDTCALVYGTSATNVFTQSENFGHADWVKIRASIVNNTTLSPEGVSNADFLKEDATASNSHFVSHSRTIPSVADYVFSVYVKRNGRDHVRLLENNGDAQAYFDLKNGKVGTTSGTGGYGIEYIADDWYRIHVIFSSLAAATINFIVYLADQDNSVTYTGDGVSGVYIWGAQLEQASSLGHYVATTALTSPVTSKSCTAAAAAGSECYNTRSTCQDTDNYKKIKKGYRFCSVDAGHPVDRGFIPCIVTDPKFTPTEIKPDAGLSTRSQVTVTVRDFPHHDRGVDPYFSTRAAPSGTFFGRLIARNPYYIGRSMITKTGYLTDTFDHDNFQSRLYILKDIVGPRMQGNEIYYDFIGKDILELANNLKTKIPAPTDATIDETTSPSGITAVSTSLTLASTSALSDFPTGGGTIMIGDEVMTYASRGSPENVLTGLTRELYGTTADSHDGGDGVQVCKIFTGGPFDVLYEILNTYLGISASYIPYSGGSPEMDWDTEQRLWYSGVNMSALFVEPEGVKDLISNLCEAFQIDLWWDEEDQQIKAKGNVPPLANASVTELTDNGHLIKEKTSVQAMTDRRFSRMVLHFNKIDYSEDDKKSNFSRHHYEVDATAESSDAFDEIKTKEIKTLWLNAAEASIASQTAQRFLARFGRTTPTKFMFEVDAKDSTIKTGDLIDINSIHLQGLTGVPVSTRFQITKRKEIKQGHSYQYEALKFIFSTRNGFIADNALDTTSPMTVYDNASSAQKDANAFVGPNTGLFPDDGNLYVII